MKKAAVLKRLKTAARQAGLEYREVELTNHTGVIVGATRSTIGRHSEMPDQAAKKFWDQFASELGKGWWR
ncbi:ribonuclease PH [Leifsonia sp. NPDC077715]|uniref:ribonuclease PH n=1 Tax=Leifsonia sp. NPDC077715 TaxID=3155539 RepID=UPI003414C0A8